MSARTDEEMVEAYRQHVGKDPDESLRNDPDWNYRGTKEERESLRAEIEAMERIEQATLFDAA